MSIVDSSAARRGVMTLTLMFPFAYLLIPAVRSPFSTALFLCLFTVHVGLYAWCWHSAKSHPAQWATWPGFMISRAAMLFMWPWLSDDVFGYLWYGRLLVNGINPFAVLASDPSLVWLRNDIYPLLAFKNYPAIYPPLAELGFGLSALVSKPFGGGVVSSLLAWKVVLITCEVLVVAALRRSPFPSHTGLLYVLNPLIIVEVAGQAHVDGLLIFPMVVLMASFAGAAATSRQALRVGVAVAAMTLIKLHPIATLWAAIIRFRTPRHLAFLALASMTPLVLLSAFFFWQDHVRDMFFGVLSFFNSTYFGSFPLLVLRGLGDAIGVEQWWIKAPAWLSLLRVAVLAAIVLYTVRNRWVNTYCLLYLLMTTVIMLSPKIHPWYAVPLLVMGIGLANPWFAFTPMALLLSYSYYAIEPNQEYTWLTAVQWCLGATGAILGIRREHIASLKVTTNNSPHRSVGP